jgi:hypothetical protein
MLLLSSGEQNLEDLHEYRPKLEEETNLSKMKGLESDGFLHVEQGK